MDDVRPIEDVRGILRELNGMCHSLREGDRAGMWRAGVRLIARYRHTETDGIVDGWGEVFDEWAALVMAGRWDELDALTRRMRRRAVRETAAGDEDAALNPVSLTGAEVAALNEAIRRAGG